METAKARPAKIKATPAAKVRLNVSPKRNDAAAAIRGEGVAPGRSVLVAEDLAQGRLVALFPKARLDVERGYDLVYAIGTQDHPKLRAFRSWISAEVREFAADIQPDFVDAVR
ncbi:hypothetical protein [Rhizobium phaseoli]|uniref:hypothetical protein n=1 Tax=Rhizobium phaseoli TaxID=396 RepID=UPI00030BC627